MADQSEGAVDCDDKDPEDVLKEIPPVLLADAVVGVGTVVVHHLSAAAALRTVVHLFLRLADDPTFLTNGVRICSLDSILLLLLGDDVAGVGSGGHGVGP